MVSSLSFAPLTPSLALVSYNWTDLIEDLENTFHSPGRLTQLWLPACFYCYQQQHDLTHRLLCKSKGELVFTRSSVNPT